jgi:hypothetical protein
MLKRLIGVSGLLCGLLLASGALARPHPGLTKDRFDKVGRPDTEQVKVTRDSPKTYHRTAAANPVKPAAPVPACLQQRRQRGELWEGVGRPTGRRATPTQQGGQQPIQSGKSPIERKAEQRANCSEFSNCSAPASARPAAQVSGPWMRRDNPHAQIPTRPQVFDRGKNNAPYVERVKLVRYNILKSAFMPELGQSCRNGTDCWLP